jgi:hypothetical protein
VRLPPLCKVWAAVVRQRNQAVVAVDEALDEPVEVAPGLGTAAQLRGIELGCPA